MVHSLALKLLRGFAADDRGHAMVFVAIMLPVLIGFSLLTVDMSRVNNLHNDLQSAADSFALAGAAELDGGVDAIERANRAIANLVVNQSRFSTAGTRTLTDADLVVTYLDDIPPSDATALDEDGLGADGIDYSTTDNALAKYALVTVQPTAFQTIFPAALLGAPSTMNVSTQSVGGYGSAVCDYTPLFICNPYGSLEDMQTALSGTSRPMMLLKKHSGGNNAQYGPGNYGYLTNTDDSRRNQDIAEMLAVTNPRACYSDDGVRTKSGNIPALNDALNVRFDIYGNGNVTGYNISPALNPPAPNVRKGMKVRTQGQCRYDAPNNNEAEDYMALPKDNCFASGTCDAAGALPNRIGNGAWNFDTYWDTNWPAATNAENANHKAAIRTDEQCGANPSRYCVYKYEVTHKDTLYPGAELTEPQCNTTIEGPDRRLLYVAVIDCAANPVSGGGGTYPVQVFASIFLTEPAGSPPDADIYGELVDITTNYGNGTLEQFQRNEAQLYR
jgi:Flp pilus assembly protein TadG